jgi:hypothetical protein
VQQHVLTFLAVAQTCSPLRDAYNFIPAEYAGRNIQLLAKLLKVDADTVHTAVGSNSALARSGLVRVQSFGLLENVVDTHPTEAAPSGALRLSLSEQSKKLPPHARNQPRLTILDSTSAAVYSYSCFCIQHGALP